MQWPLNDQSLGKESKIGILFYRISSSVELVNGVKDLVMQGLLAMNVCSWPCVFLTGMIQSLFWLVSLTSCKSLGRSSQDLQIRSWIMNFALLLS